MNKMMLTMACALGAACLTIAPAVIAGQEPLTLGHAKELVIKVLPPKTQTAMTVTSPAFKEGAMIPYENTQYRGNIFPGLTWTKGPAGTRSYAVIVQGRAVARPDSVTSIQMTLFNVPAAVTTLKAGMSDPPAGATYGENVHGVNQAYVGPHTHTAAPGGYYYQVFALDTTLELPSATSFDAMVDAMTGHVLASGELMGTSVRDPESKDEPLSAIPARVETGLITGVPGRTRGIMVYKGVPFAAPPVGDLRFKAPQPPIAWEGVRKADHFGDVCPQSGGGGGGPKESMSEDCLYANIWTGASFANERRPVFVWVYGGGFTSGSGSSPQFDGEALARKGIVVVTFNYRMGVFGFLATPELTRESGHNASSNYGLMDDIALLQWVRKNITAFGGDPNKVTVGGQSAGAGTVGFLAMSPLAKGLFQRGIQQSHARDPRDTELRFLSVSVTLLKNAEAAGLKFQEQAGAHSLKELRAMPWEQLVLKGMPTDDTVDTGSNATTNLYRPVVDGWVLPRNYSETYATRSQNKVAIMAGNNRDESGAVPESTLAQRNTPANKPLRPGLAPTYSTLADFQAGAKRKFGALAGEYLKLYPATNDEQAGLQWDASVRDNSRISTYLWGTAWKPGTGQPVYTYFWTHRPTGSANGASHGSEVLFIFNNLDMRKQPWTEVDRKVANAVSTYWANFIATGNPNGPGLANWPVFDAKSPTVMELGDQFAPIPVSTPEKLNFWKRFFATQKAW